MLFNENPNEMGRAIADFHRARGRADLKELLSHLTGESNQLLSYDEVRQKLVLQGGTERGVRDIPLDAIVGSVGRYTLSNIKTALLDTRYPRCYTPYDAVRHRMPNNQISVSTIFS
jgi:hypothetical protein